MTLMLNELQHRLIPVEKAIVCRILPSITVMFASVQHGSCSYPSFYPAGYWSKITAEWADDSSSSDGEIKNVWSHIWYAVSWNSG